MPRKPSRLLLAFLAWGCTDNAYEPEPWDPKAPVLESLAIITDTVLLNPIMPVAFLGEEFTMRLDLPPAMGPGLFTYPDTSYHPWKFEGGNQLRWTPGQDTSGKSNMSHLGVHAVPMRIELQDGRILQSRTRITVLGEKINPRILGPDFRRFPDVDNTGKYAVDFGDNSFSGTELFTTRRGYPQALFVSLDFMSMHCIYFDVKDSDGRGIASFPSPLTVTLRYRNMEGFDRIDKQDLELYRSDPAHPLGFIPIFADHDTSAGIFTATVNQLGLFTIGIVPWSSSRKRSHGPSQKPIYTMLFPVSDGPGDFRIYVHDSIPRLWLFGDTVQGIPDKDSLLSLIEALHDSATEKLGAFFGNGQSRPSTHLSLPYPIYITLEKKPEYITGAGVRLSAFSLGGDLEKASPLSLGTEFFRQLLIHRLLESARPQTGKNLEYSQAVWFSNVAAEYFAGSLGKGPADQAFPTKLPTREANHHWFGFDASRVRGAYGPYASWAAFLATDTSLRENLTPANLSDHVEAIAATGWRQAFSRWHSSPDTLALLYAKFISHPDRREALGLVPALSINLSGSGTEWKAISFRHAKVAPDTIIASLDSVESTVLFKIPLPVSELPAYASLFCDVASSSAASLKQIKSDATLNPQGLLVSLATPLSGKAILSLANGGPNTISFSSGALYLKFKL